MIMTEGIHAVGEACFYVTLPITDSEVKHGPLS